METQPDIPVAFFVLVGIAAVIAAAGWAIPRVLRALAEMPPGPTDRVLENLHKPTWSSAPEPPGRLIQPQGGSGTATPRRTKAAVLAERGTVVGCCDRHADMLGCDCLERAAGGTGCSICYDPKCDNPCGKH